jgi:hypothetical protein
MTKGLVIQETEERESGQARPATPSFPPDKHDYYG